MSRYPTLYILRHGETEWNLANRLQGHFDSPLTERGREQAAAQNAILKHCDLAGFSALSSPQGKTSSHQRERTMLISLRPSAARFPQLGRGSWIPIPRKLRKDSARMAAGTASVPYTRIVPAR